MTDLIGQTLRGYEIREKIGEGGYGAVYRAYQSTVDRDVAVKVILAQHANKPEFAQRFETEARLVAKLEHPHIVPLHDYWREDSGAYLVMRWLHTSLRATIHKQGALSLAQTARLLDQIADALAVAHQAGVIHRDLKPDNILLDERGNAYLTDFGIAKQLDSGDHITGTDGIVGTLAYLAPEQIQNDPLGAQTDIYALGIMLYELLAGEHPFSGTPPAMLVMKHLQVPMPPLTTKRPGLPPNIDAVLQQATAKDPAERYANAPSVASAFRDAAQLTPNAPVVVKSSVGAQSIRAQHVAPLQPLTSEQRNRANMLQNVQRFWIEGVLENSLHGAALLELGMKQSSGTIDHAWDTLLRTPDSPDKTLPPHTEILDVFDKLNGKLLILGDPGSGKTTTLLELARDLLFRAENDEAHPIPVIFNLSSWSESHKPLVEWLVDELSSKYQVPKKVAQTWVESDALLLLLDGLDEVASAQRDACVQAINTYRGEHGFVDVVVCSRIVDYEVLTNRLKLNGAIVIQPLDDAQVDRYLASFGGEMDTVRQMIAKDETLLELARSPLMLSIMALAYRGASTDDLPKMETPEAQRKHIFDVYVRRMFERRVGEKLYTQEQTTHYLSWLARKMQEHAQSVFQIEELQPDLLSANLRKYYNLIIRLVNVAGITVIYTFGSWISGSVIPVNVLPFVLGNMLLGVPLGLILTVDRKIWTNPLPHILIGIISAVVWYVTMLPTDSVTKFFVVAMGFSNVGTGSYVSALIFDQMKHDFNHIHTKEVLKLSLQEIKPLIVIVSILSSVIPNLIMSHWVNPNGGWTNWIFGSVLSGVGYAALITVASSFVSSDVALRVRPNQGIQQSLQTALRTTAIIMLFFLVAFASAFPAVTLKVSVGLAIGYGISFAYVLFMVYGGYVYLQHYILRIFLSRAEQLPYGLVQFLDYAAALIFLRKVGGGYIFVHRYLLEYFAGLEDNSSS